MDIRFNDAITAYHPPNSCETLLLRLVKNWKAEFDRKNIVGVLALNMSTAFDSVCLALLIKKLQAYNFSESALNLMRWYFHQREN